MDNEKTRTDKLCEIQMLTGSIEQIKDMAILFYKSDDDESGDKLGEISKKGIDKLAAMMEDL